MTDHDRPDEGRRHERHRHAQHGHRERTLDWWVPVLFMIGSACFALGSFPGFSSVVPAGVVGAVFFIGSLFFTSAGYGQLRQSLGTDPATGRTPWFGLRPGHLDWWAAAIQSVGTLWFNINTFEAMQAGFTTRQENLRVWTPDFIGSICFLVASELAIWVVCRAPVCWRRHDADWEISMINMAGSFFFMASAFAAFVLPDTDQLLDATLANSGTFLGALCFFVAAWRQLRTVIDRPDPAPLASG